MGEDQSVRFCWSCGNKLSGNHYVRMSVPKWSGDDCTRILHKECAKRYENDEPQKQSHNEYLHELETDGIDD